MKMPTTDALRVRSYTYAGRRTFCIHVPTLDKKFDVHMMRNSGYDNAARAVPGRGCFFSGAEEAGVGEGSSFIKGAL
jgi:hypothetical protein